jgi:Leucine-rich repeat (LRR) protein
LIPVEWIINKDVIIQMIKQNRRVPGTINSTPINKVKHSTFYNENSSEANERAGYPQPMQQVKKDKLATWKSNNLAESFANSEYGLIELSLKQRGIKDIEGSIDQTIKCHLVSVLDLSSNLLVNFPPKIFNKLSNLTKLYLNGNKL